MVTLTPEQRGEIYCFLANSLAKQPTAAMIDYLSGFDPTLKRYSVLVAASRASSDVAAAAKRLGESALRYSSQDLVKDLRIAYTHLLRGLRRHNSPPPPYESVYREGVVFGDSTIDVRNEYERFGLALGDRFMGEPPDHIALELDFMRHLCVAEERASARRDRAEILRLVAAQQHFFLDHLGKWATQLFGKIRQYDNTGFYHCLVDFAEAWLAFDEKELASIVKSRAISGLGSQREEERE